jgi:hypothetical protein
VSVRELEFEGIGDVYCPVCGRKVYGEGGEVCPHVLFIMEDGELAYAQDWLLAICEKLAEGCDYTDLVNLAPSGSVIVAMSETGIACGPISYEVIVGFEVPPGEESKLDLSHIVKFEEEKRRAR